MERVRLPADIELEDRLAFGLTARQLSILGATALLAYGVFALAASALPFAVAAGGAAPFALAGTLLALGRRDGLSADRLALAAARFLARPRRRVLAPEGTPAPLPVAPARRSLAPLDLPVQTVLRSGLVELDGEGFCLLTLASSTSFELRSTEEQAALVEAFGRFLNGLSEPIQIVVRSERVDLAERAAELEGAASELADPALRRAALGHARFLGELDAAGDVRRREILLVLSSRAADRQTAKASLERRAAEATDLARAAGVELRVLRGEEAAALLARALAPPGPPPGCELSGVVTGC
jgi:hypothetical protein